jgi:hypothetical protein
MCRSFIKNGNLLYITALIGKLNLITQLLVVIKFLQEEQIVQFTADLDARTRSAEIIAFQCLIDCLDECCNDVLSSLIAKRKK